MKPIRILLVGNPKVVMGFDRIMRLPNLGLCSIAGNLDRNICEANVVDLVVAGRRPRIYFQRLLKKLQPDVVGLSSMHYQCVETLELAKIAKGLNKDTKVVMGGYYPSIDFDMILERDDMHYIDFLIRNEGEVAFNTLIRELHGKHRFENVPNLSYRDNGSIKHNPSGGLLDLNKLKLPDRDVRVIKKGFHFFGVPADCVETSRGCVFKCKFCNITQMYGPSFRTYKIERVIEDLRRLQGRGTKSVFMVDDNITLDGNRYKELCQAIIDAKLDNIRYEVQASVDGIKSTPGLVGMMIKSGVRTLQLGIESAFGDNLDFLGKRDRFKNIDTYEVIKEFRKHNVTVIGTFILGNPDDTEESIFEIFEYARSIDIDMPLFLLLTPYPKTALREELMEQGLITNLDDYSKYDLFQANVKTKHLTSKRLYELREKLAYKAYNNPTVVRRLFKNMPRAYVKHILKYMIEKPGDIVGYFRGAFRK